LCNSHENDAHADDTCRDEQGLGGLEKRPFKRATMHIKADRDEHAAEEKEHDIEDQERLADCFKAREAEGDCLKSIVNF